MIIKTKQMFFSRVSEEPAVKAQPSLWAQPMPEKGRGVAAHLHIKRHARKHFHQK